MKWCLAWLKLLFTNLHICLHQFILWYHFRWRFTRGQQTRPSSRQILLQYEVVRSNTTLMFFSELRQLILYEFTLQFLFLRSRENCETNIFSFFVICFQLFWLISVLPMCSTSYVPIYLVIFDSITFQLLEIFTFSTYTSYFLAPANTKLWIHTLLSKIHFILIFLSKITDIGRIFLKIMNFECYYLRNVYRPPPTTVCRVRVMKYPFLLESCRKFYS